MRVNVVTSDRGWILERLAGELVSRLPYVVLGDAPDPSADINYYVTYSCRGARCPTIEVALFTHLEESPAAAEKFFSVAEDIDVCICMSQIYADTIKARGIDDVCVIAPGVDLEQFRPRLKIGVVGRTYHTGRKGEKLVERVMDVPGIDWYFTGEGWPGPALNLPSDEMPAFYRSMDYILVPALYEGGPMCVPEALACGTQVIAPPIGWVPSYPHVEFRTGDADDLARVLRGLVEEREAVRQSVTGQSWDVWAEKHDQLFRKLIESAATAPGRTGPVASPATKRRVSSVSLVLHGSEVAVSAKSLGGPSVRVPRLASELGRYGVKARVVASKEIAVAPDPASLVGDLIHGFNVWPPLTSVQLARMANRLSVPYVFSPIFLDLKEFELWQEYFELFKTTHEPDIDEALYLARKRYAEKGAFQDKPNEVMSGYYSRVRFLADNSDALILLSEKERIALSRIGARTDHGTLVRNPVDAEMFASADPDLFRTSYGVDDYVLCVGRIEPRKNQLLLAHALRGTGIPLVIVGHDGSPDYGRLLRSCTGADVRVIGRLEPNSPMLRSAIAGSRVFALPSWAEGAPLSALEAAASGANLVLSDRSGEQEYFGDYARYCDPSDPVSIRSAVLEAFEAPPSKELRDSQKQHVSQQFSLRRHIEATLDVYDKVLESRSSRSDSGHREPVGAPAKQPSIIFDLTTIAHVKGRLTGISRLESTLGRLLSLQPGGEDVKFVVWNGHLRRFVLVPKGQVKGAQLSALVEEADPSLFDYCEAEPGTTVIVGGSAWMQNSEYLRCLVSFVNEGRFRLVPIICDLIPIDFPFWYEKDYSKIFQQNLLTLLRAASHILAISDSTKKDLVEFLFANGESAGGIDTIRLGDDWASEDCSDEPASTPVDLGGRPFVLSVGAIHTRKNHALLYEVWKKLAGSEGDRCPLLVIVGGVAWNGHDVARAMSEDKRVSRHIRILKDVDDASLAWLYDHCLFTVYPSHYEGWGLPVAESLRRGKLCLAGNTSSLPEIAPSLVEHLEPTDINLWFTRIRFLSNSANTREEKERQIRETYQPHSWSKTAADVLRLVESGSCRPLNAYFLGSEIAISASGEASLFLGDGWGGSSPEGRLANHAGAVLRLNLSEAIEDDLFLGVSTTLSASTGRAQIWEVLVNGRKVASWSFYDEGVSARYCRVPREAVGPDGLIEIVFRLDASSTAENLSRDEDGEIVRLKVARMILDVVGSADDLRDRIGRSGSDEVVVEPMRTYRPFEDGLFEGAPFGEGWVPVPEGGAAPLKRLGALRVCLAEAPLSDVLVEIDLFVVSPVQIVFLANGNILDRVDFDRTGFRTQRLAVPAATRWGAMPLQIALLSEAIGKDGATSKDEDEYLYTVFGIRAWPETLEPRSAKGVGYSDALVAGRPLSFGLDAEGAAPSDLVAFRGWHVAEPGGRWSAGETATLRFRPEQIAGPAVVFRVVIIGIAPGAAFAKLGLAVNGTWVGQFDCQSGHRSELWCLFEWDATDPRPVEIELQSDRSTSCVALGLSEDARELGFRVDTVRLDDAFSREGARFVLPTGIMASFGSSDAGEISGNGFLLSGWHGPEWRGVWSRGAEAHLRFCVDCRSLQEQFFLEFVISDIAPGSRGPIELSFKINDVDFGMYTVNAGNSVVVGPVLCGSKPVLIVDAVLTTSYSVVPAEVVNSSDTRRLGFMLGSVRVVSG